MELIDIRKVIKNPDNPRIIRDTKYHKLVKSIKEFPEMLKLRPIVVNNDMVVLGGNMRLRACKEAGLKEVWIMKADNLTPMQEREFVVKDNVNFGEWDWDLLANEWNSVELPVSNSEKQILELIKQGFHDINKIENTNISLSSFLKLNTNDVMDKYLFHHYF